MQIINSKFNVIPKKIDIHDVIEILITTLNVRNNETFEHNDLIHSRKID